jgi:signal transduction histidine kinase
MSARAVAGVALLVLAFAEVQSLAIGMRQHAHLRSRVQAEARQLLVAGQPEIEQLLVPRTAGAYAAAADVARGRLGATEVEFLDAEGRRLFADPRPAPIEHVLGRDDRKRVSAGDVLSFGPLFGPESRVVAYARARARDSTVIVRLATEVDAVVDDLRARRVVLAVQALALLLLLVGAGYVLAPTAAGGSEEAPLMAYEDAMVLLRQREAERHRVHEAEREQLERRAEDNATLARAGELTAGIAHEVRNGLGTIAGHARLLERATELGAVAASAGAIREECETLEAVVRRFVEYVRDERMVPAPFDASGMVARVVARETRGGGARVVPGAPIALTLLGDEDLLERAVENLLRNAIEAAGPDGTVRLHLEKGAETARVVVADNGPGLSEQLRAGIRPFVTTKPGGLGLGLATVQKIARLHGGRLAFGDNKPRGTVAILELPLPPG